jgi:hypothetical protein
MLSHHALARTAYAAPNGACVTWPVRQPIRRLRELGQPRGQAGKRLVREASDCLPGPRARILRSAFAARLNRGAPAIRSGV